MRRTRDPPLRIGNNISPVINRKRVIYRDHHRHKYDQLSSHTSPQTAVQCIQQHERELWTNWEMHWWSAQSALSSTPNERDLRTGPAELKRYTQYSILFIVICVTGSLLAQDPLPCNRYCTIGNMFAAGTDASTCGHRLPHVVRSVWNCWR